MPFKEYIERAFGSDAEDRILHFLVEKELHNCGNHAERWLGLFGKCEHWRNEFLLWEENTFISGVSGWNLEMDVCKLCLPEEADDWTEYLYRMTLLAVVNQMEPGEKNSVVANGQKYNNFSSELWFPDYWVQSGFTDLTKEQWLKEVAGLLDQSWERYQKFPGNSARYQKDMELNYPKFGAALEYLAQNVGECEIVRMNQHGGDETVWYFVKAQDCFYLMYLSDSM